MKREDFINYIEYNPDTGIFYWSVDYRCNKKGDEAGRNHSGYKYLKIKGVGVYLHKVAWFIIHGEFPFLIDHINKDRSDNKLKNLRSVTKVENGMNRKISSNNRSGTTGVSFCKNQCKWVAQISNNKKRIVIGYFKHKDEAILARLDKEQEYGYTSY